MPEDLAKAVKELPRTLVYDHLTDDQRHYLKAAGDHTTRPNGEIIAPHAELLIFHHAGLTGPPVPDAWARWGYHADPNIDGRALIDAVTVLDDLDADDLEELANP